MKTSMQLEELEQEVAERAASKLDLVAPAGSMAIEARELLEEVNAVAADAGDAYARTFNRLNGNKRIEGGLAVQGPAGHTVLQGFGQAAVDLDMVRPGTELAVRSEQRLVLPAGMWPMRDLAHTQMANYLGIPIAYYNRLRAEQPNLLSANVNTLAAARPYSEQRFVRVERGEVRALLSDRYRPLDNDALLGYLMPSLKRAFSNGLFEFRSCEVNDTRFYLKATSPRVQGRVLGDIVQIGFIIENSEVGLGALSVFPTYYVIGCTNMAIMTVLGSRKRHTGARMSVTTIDPNELDEGDRRFMSDETRKATDAARKAADKAFFMQAADLVNATFNQESVDAMLQQLNLAAGYEIPEKNALPAVREVATRFELSEAETDLVTQDFLGKDMFTIWGLSNSITWLAGQTESYNRATALERAGGTLVNLDPSEWRTIASARTKD